MGKRSDFIKHDRDFYRSPPEVVVPLLPFLKDGSFFIEPCAGDGALAQAIETKTFGNVMCSYASDIHPIENSWREIEKQNALEVDYLNTFGDYIITNPPWSRDKKSDFILHRMIETFSAAKPTWLLFDSDWKHTRQATPYLSRLHAVVAIGRVKWFPDSKMTGKDNVCWYLFGKPDQSKPQFYGRGVIPSDDDVQALYQKAL